MQIRRVQVDGPDGSYGISYADWGDADGRAHRRLRPRPDPQRPRLRPSGPRAGADARVICPDVAGRGLSDPLTNPEDYALPTYVGHMAQLLAKLGLAEVDWVGTSMGGLIGMGVAAMRGEPDPPAGAERRRAVPAQGGARADQELSRAGAAVCSLEALEAHLREIHAGFGPLTDAEWRHLAEHSAARREDGRFGLNYDQRLSLPMTAGPIENIELWPVWEQIRCPVLVLRGTDERSAAGRDGSRDDQARAQGRGHRDRRHRPCARPDGQGPDRDRARLAQRLTRVPRVQGR